MATTVYALRLDKVIVKQLREKAKLERRTVASLIRYLLDQYLAGKEAK